MSKQLARGVIVNYGGSALQGLTDCSLNLTTAFASSQTKEDITPVDEPLRVDWEISVSGEYGREATAMVGAHAMKTNSKAGTIKDVSFIIGDLATYSGNCIISSFSESAPVDGKITYSATLKGVSSLTKAE
jgi:predicted secreted protein